MRRFLEGVMVFAAMTPTTLVAQTATTYTYDALGRLVRSNVTGGSAAPTDSSITYDAAGNRTGYKVTGAAGGTGAGGGPNGSSGGGQGGVGGSGTTTFIVVPLNGFSLIPIRMP